MYNINKTIINSFKNISQNWTLIWSYMNLHFIYQMHEIYYKRKGTCISKTCQAVKNNNQKQSDKVTLKWIDYMIVRLYEIMNRQYNRVKISWLRQPSDALTSGWAKGLSELEKIAG